MSTPKCILVVDDDDAIRYFIDIALSDQGYNVTTAANGAAALEILRSVQPDLILLDMRMPVMDGWKFAETYRERPGRHASIVVLTAAVNARDSMARIQAHACLSKPFALSELFTCVEQYAGLP